MTELVVSLVLAAASARADVPPPNEKDLPAAFSTNVDPGHADESLGGRQRLEVARARLREGKYLSAERIAAGGVAETPSDPEVYELIAWAQLKQGRWGPAIKNATSAITLAPARARPYVLRAFGYELKGVRSGLIGDLESAVKRDKRYKPLLARARGIDRVFRPAGSAAMGEAVGDRFVLRGESESSDLGTDDALFLDGVVPKAGGLPTLSEALPILGILGFIGLLAGLLARRAWTTRRAGRERAGPPSDVWDVLLGWLGGAFARLEERLTGRPAPVAGPAAQPWGARAATSPQGAPRSGSAAHRGQDSSRAAKTPPHAPRPQPAAKPPGLPAGAAGDARAKYEQVRMLGRNEDGVLWEAFDRSLHRAVALEEVVLPPGDSRRQASLARARELAHLRHPAIIDLYEAADLGDRLWLIFELLEGRTLRDHVAEGGRLRFEEAREILAPVCEALEFAHGRGLMHGHLKPSRVILADAGYVKLSGFEVIQDVGRGRRYLAPEAERGQTRPESDVYSLGVCLYEALAGRSPFRDDDLDRKLRLEFARLAPLSIDAPAGIDTFLALALSPTPETRIRSPRQFLEGLRAAETTAAPPPPAPKLAAGKPDWWKKFKKRSR